MNVYRSRVKYWGFRSQKIPSKLQLTRADNLFFIRGPYEYWYECILVRVRVRYEHRTNSYTRFEIGGIFDHECEAERYTLCPYSREG